MVLKIRKRDKSKETVHYKSAKKILTPQDIKEADRFDNALNNEIREIEKVLLKKELLSSDVRKYDVLKSWYLIGVRINQFLKNHKVSPEEESLFWDHLYGRSSLINKTLPTGKISKTRNDFKTASLLAYYPLNELQKTGPWALWREILRYKAFKDERVLNWVLEKLEESPPRAQKKARPFLKSVSARLKRIDTTVLNSKELLEKLEGIKEQEKGYNLKV